MRNGDRPAAVEAERALLGAMMSDDTGSIADEVLALGTVRAEHFYMPAHQELFKLIATLRDQGTPCDIVVVAHAIRAYPERYGGTAYVVDLPSCCVSLANAVSHYVPIIVSTANARTLFDSAFEMQRQVLANEDPRLIAETMASRLATIESGVQNVERPVTIGEAVRAVEAERGKGPVPYVPSMFPALDKILSGGFYAGDLVVVAGRPSWGKTAFSLSVLIEQTRAGYTCGLISLEMRRDKIVQRVISQLAALPTDVVKAGGFDAMDRAAIQEAHDLASNLPLLLDTRSGLSMQDIRQTCKVWRAKHGLDALVIDYLGLVRTTETKGRTEAQVIGSIVKDCKRLAGDFAIPVILCAQLNREVVRTAPVKAPPNSPWWAQITMPQLHHLRDSGDIEQDADVVLFPIPADVLRAQKVAPNLKAPPGSAVLNVAKNRQGALEDIPVRWNGPTTRYSPDAPPVADFTPSTMGERDYNREPGDEDPEDAYPY